MSRPVPLSKDFVQAYLEAALFTGTDRSDESGGEPLDRNYSIDDFATSAVDMAVRDCNRFMRENAYELAAAGDDVQNGHDFWLTRNRHGAGFWDRDYDKVVGDSLTKASQEFGEAYVYIGDDGLLYFVVIRDPYSGFVQP